MKSEEFTTAVGYKPKSKRTRRVVMLLCAAFFTLHSSLFTSCSESDGEDDAEYTDWQARNDAYFLTLEDSLSRNAAVWEKWKTFTKNENTPGVNTDYVYVKWIEKNTFGKSPLYTDSVRVAYRGRLIPSASYPQGYVFDQTYSGTYDLRTTDVSNSYASSYVDGFSTALQHMRRGDRCVVYIPYQLGYGATAKNAIPAFSVLIFDLVLLDFSTGSERMEPWS